MGFCKEYNAATQDKEGTVIPVEITVYDVSLMTLWQNYSLFSFSCVPLIKLKCSKSSGRNLKILCQ